jgi:hypothetical protein
MARLRELRSPGNNQPPPNYHNSPRIKCPARNCSAEGVQRQLVPVNLKNGEGWKSTKFRGKNNDKTCTVETRASQNPTEYDTVINQVSCGCTGELLQRAEPKRSYRGGEAAEKKRAVSP